MGGVLDIFAKRIPTRTHTVGFFSMGETGQLGPFICTKSIAFRNGSLGTRGINLLHQINRPTGVLLINGLAGPSRRFCS
jgi:hypothetical protein